MGLPRFAVVDIETSGLSTRRHRILQVAVVTAQADGTVIDEWSTLVRLRWPWSRVGPRRVHGIRRRDLRGAPPVGVALRELARRIDGDVFTAHNAGFDAAFLRRAARREGITLDLDRQLDTLTLSRRLDPDRTLPHGLASVCDRYGVVIDRHHDARCDARATAALLPYLLAAHDVTDETGLEAVLWRPRRRRPDAASVQSA